MKFGMKESLFVRIGRWYTNGGGIKMLGRTVLLIGIILALGFAAVGYDDMVRTCEADEIIKNEANVKKAQERAYKQLVKDAKKAEKNGETPPEIPEDASMIEVEVKHLENDLMDYVGDYITNYILWGILSLAAGVGLNWFFGNVQDMIAALKKAGSYRVTAGAFFWCGVVVAVVIAAFGVVEIMAIKKSTLAEVGDVLLKKYIIWSIAAIGVGYGIQRLMLKFPATKEHVMSSGKSNALCHGLYLTAVALWPFAVTACAMAAISHGWITALCGLAGVVVVLLVTWLLSGACPLIRTQEEVAEAAERRMRTTWVCACGAENPRSTAVCGICGEVKPKN